MNIKKGLLLLFCLSIFVVVGCQKKDSPKKVEKPKEISRSGIITAIDGQQYTMDEKVFDVSGITTQETFHVKDEVSISYMRNEAKNKVIKATKLVLKKSHYEENIKAIMAAMSIEEKVGQLFMVRCPVYDGASVASAYQPGGYIVFDANIAPFSKAEFIANVASYQANSKVPMLIGVDEEGGSVIRFSRYLEYRNSPFLSPQALYANGGMDAIVNDTQEKSQLLKALGVNVNFAPVADISTNPNDFMYDRSFAQEGEGTANYIRNVVAVMKKQQMGSVLKHFPGYGSNADTHTGSSYDTRNLETFRSSDFIPFIAGVNAGADFVLVNHNVISSMDANAPASLSSTVHHLLRDELNFKGVVISDDLVMQAITNEYGDALSAVLAIEAGNDMLISSSFEVQYNAVLEAVRAGRISEQRINESLMRILRIKHHLGLIEE